MSEEKRENGTVRAFFNISHDLMVQLDADGIIQDCNSTWCERLGGRADGFLGRPFLDFVDTDDQNRMQDLLGHEGPHFSGGGFEMRLLHGDGSVVWVKPAAQKLSDPPIWVMAFKDLTVQKRFEAELHRSELIDDLSGAYNRRYFLNRAFEELLRSVRYQSEISLLLINLDGLADINEQYSQYAGDQVIRKSAQTCLKTLRNTDLFGRMGDGAFACLLVETPLEGALVIADRIRSAIAGNEIVYRDSLLTITASVGVSGRSGSDVSIEEMLNRAQNALNEAKQAGGNRVAKAAQ